MSSGPRIVFFGYSEVGYATLDLLLRRGCNVAAVFTHEADVRETTWFRSVPKLAQDAKIPVYTPESLKAPEWEATLRELRPDLILSMYYRNMIPTRLLNLAPLGAYNMHGSYLPRYRGRAPLNWAIINGEDHTGVSLHVMVKEADAGDVIDQEKVPIGPEEPAAALTDRIRDAAVRVLERQLDLLLAGKAVRHPQDHSKATYFGKRTPEDGRINWALPARAVFNLIRAVTRPFPGAFTDVRGARLVVWWARVLPASHVPSEATPGQVLSTAPLRIATADGALELTDVSWVDPTNPKLAVPAPELFSGSNL